jgi:hypothetical protein
MLLTRSVEVLDPVDVDAGRRFTVRLCRWSTPSEWIADTDGRYREQFDRGNLAIADRVPVWDQHHGTVIGRALPDTFAEHDDGPTVDVVLAATAAADDVIALYAAGVIDSVSMEYAPGPTRRAGELLHRTGTVHGIAFALNPAHDAPILEHRTTTEGNQTTMTTDTAPAVMPDTPALPAPTVTTEAVTVDVLNRALADTRDDVLRTIAVRDRDTDPNGSPITRFRSLVDFADHVYTERDPAARELLTRSLADQITANNPGVVPPAWVNEIAGIVDRGRPVVNAFGLGSLDDAGMDVDWPYFDGDLLTMVGEQTAEKTAITSVRVDIKRGFESLATYAGGSDISYQLIRRSRPGYRDAYMRIMYAAYAAVTDRAATLAAVEAAGSHVTYDPAGDTDGSKFRPALFAASVKIEAATGAPAGFVLAATDMFVKLGGTLPAPMYGYGAESGQAAASTLRVEVSGVPVLHAPYAADGTLLASNASAGDWFEDGPFPVAADDVEKLGQDVAVWGLGAFGAMVPAGIVVMSKTAPAGG